MNRADDAELIRQAQQRGGWFSDETIQPLPVLREAFGTVTGPRFWPLWLATALAYLLFQGLSGAFSYLLLLLVYVPWWGGGNFFAAYFLLHPMALALSFGFVWPLVAPGLYRVYLDVVEDQPCRVYRLFSRLSSYARARRAALMLIAIVVAFAAPAPFLVTQPDFVRLITGEGASAGATIAMLLFLLLLFAVPCWYVLYFASRFVWILAGETELGGWALVRTSYRLIQPHFLPLAALFFIVALVEHAGLLLSCIPVAREFVFVYLLAVGGTATAIAYRRLASSSVPLLEPAEDALYTDFGNLEDR